MSDIGESWCSVLPSPTWGDQLLKIPFDQVDKSYAAHTFMTGEVHFDK